MTAAPDVASVFLLAENRLLREALTKIFERKAIWRVVGLAPSRRRHSISSLGRPECFGFGLLRRRLAPGVSAGSKSTF